MINAIVGLNVVCMTVQCINGKEALILELMMKGYVNCDFMTKLVDM